MPLDLRQFLTTNSMQPVVPLEHSPDITEAINISKKFKIGDYIRTNYDDLYAENILVKGMIYDITENEIYIAHNNPRYDGILSPNKRLPPNKHYSWRISTLLYPSSNGIIEKINSNQSALRKKYEHPRKI